MGRITDTSRIASIRAKVDAKRSPSLQSNSSVSSPTVKPRKPLTGSIYDYEDVENVYQGYIPKVGDIIDAGGNLVRTVAIKRPSGGYYSKDSPETVALNEMYGIVKDETPKSPNLTQNKELAVAYLTESVPSGYFIGDDGKPTLHDTSHYDSPGVDKPPYETGGASTEHHEPRIPGGIAGEAVTAIFTGGIGVIIAVGAIIVLLYSYLRKR